MRGLAKNKQTFWYALYERSEPVLDTYGNEIGNHPVYSHPVKATGNISPARGNTESDLFGINAVYAKTINPMPVDCPISETSVLWINRPPVIEEDGSTKTGHDYVVTLAASSINHKAYIISRVSTGDADGGGSGE